MRLASRATVPREPSRTRNSPTLANSAPSRPKTASTRRSRATRSLPLKTSRFSSTRRKRELLKSPPLHIPGSTRPKRNTKPLQQAHGPSKLKRATPPQNLFIKLRFPQAQAPRHQSSKSKKLNSSAATSALSTRLQISPNLAPRTGACYSGFCLQPQSRST